MNIKLVFRALRLFVAATLTAAVLTLPACAGGLGGQATAAQVPEVEGLTLCTDPRPQICIQDYRPVCAQMNDGSFKIYSNGCSACTDTNVVGYRNRLDKTGCFKENGARE